jgi:hypothetical protein
VKGFLLPQWVRVVQSAGNRRFISEPSYKNNRAPELKETGGFAEFSF